MRYPVKLTKDDNDTYLVQFPDVPGAITYGDTREEALKRAPDALLTVFDALMKDRHDIPIPSASDGPSIEVPPLEAAKIELYRAMQTSKVGKAELARRLDWHLPQVDRVLNVRHGSQIDQLDAAFRALGKKMAITVVDVEPPPLYDRDRGERSRPRIAMGRAAAAARQARVSGVVHRKSAVRKLATKKR